MDLWLRPELNLNKLASYKILEASVHKSTSQSKVRSPATSSETFSSAESSSNLTDLKTQQSVTLDLNCSKIKQSYSFSNVNQIRIQGTCLKDIKKITNEKNGYTANLFNLAHGVTTDLLSVEEGENPFLIEWNKQEALNRPSKINIIIEKSL